ncbi:MAG TPA: carbohydrate ABC transporter permease [Actinomycetes bacterium]|nr:carbohydrate ABC transporter permease [Actinomycetes bacterium]
MATATTSTAATTAGPPVRRPAGVASRITGALSRTSLQIILAVIAIAWMVPVFGLLIASLRTASDNSASGWWNAITHWHQLTFSSYSKLLQNDTIQHSIANTFFITIPTTVLVVFIAAMAGYAFAWVRFPGRDVIFLVVVCLLVVPLQMALIPVARLFDAVNLFGKIPGVVLFHVAFGLPFAIFLLRNFFAGIPGELMEAARLDGASELTIFFRVVLPLGLPAIASLAIFQFLWVWNDLLVALVFAGPESAPLTVAIQQQTRQFGSNIDVIAPGAFLTMIVPLIVFFGFQRYFVQGLLAGSTK